MPLHSHPEMRPILGFVLPSYTQVVLKKGDRCGLLKGNWCLLHARESLTR